MKKFGILKFLVASEVIVERSHLHYNGKHSDIFLGIILLIS